MTDLALTLGLLVFTGLLSAFMYLPHESIETLRILAGIN